MTISDLIRPNLRDLKPYSSARAEYSGSAEILLDANENPVPTDVNRYPDPTHRLLKESIATDIGVPTDNIVVGNGSDEIIDMIIRVFCIPGLDKVRVINPSFGMYEVAARINDVSIEYADLDENFQLVADRCLEGQTSHHKVLFLCSPNNPTGNSLDPDTMKGVMADWKGIVVLDEAYIDFADQPSLASSLADFPNLIILRTFSKALGAAGLRVGFGLASAEIIQVLHKVKAPYNVGSLVLRRALDIWNAKGLRRSSIAMLKSQREWLISHLRDLDFVLKIHPSDANFILVAFRDHMAVKEHLEACGIIVRDRSRMKGCDLCLRISVGTPRENDKLIKALKVFEL